MCFCKHFESFFGRVAFKKKAPQNQSYFQFDFYEFLSILKIFSCDHDNLKGS